MQTQEAPAAALQGRYVQANGIEIYYVEAGSGEPLILLHGGLVSTNPIWQSVPFAYGSHMDSLAAHFRVIAPDTRGCGRTVHEGATTITFDQLADDVIALVRALGLDRPMLAGFSEGALTALIAGIKRPELFRGIVCDAGHDMLNPTAPTFATMRMILGGRPDATEADPDATERMFSADPYMAPMIDLLKADQDGGQGAGYWKTYVRLAFDRTTKSPGYTFDDLAKITAPTLMLFGDRDEFCTPEEGVRAYRSLPNGELAILPGTGHVITEDGVRATIAFLKRSTS